MPHQCTNCERTFADGSKEMLSGCPECGGNKFQFRPEGRDGDGSDAPVGESGAGSAGLADEPPEPADRPADSVAGTVGNAAATVRDLVGGSAGPDATDASPPERETAGRPERGDPPASAGGPARSESSPAADDSDIIVAESDPRNAGEDAAQADARSQVIEPDEVPDSGGFDPVTDDSAPSPTSESTAAATGGTTERPDGRTESDGAAGTDGSGEPDGSTPGEPDGPTPDAPAGSSPVSDRTVAEQPDAERADRPDLSELREELNDQFESIRVVEPGQYELNLMELYDREAYIIALQEDGRYSIQMPEDWRDADA